MIRTFDIVFSLVGLIILSPFILILLLIGKFDTGSPIFCQKRMGRYEKPFYLIKFRTMHINTESVATHLVSTSSITRWGSFLRKSKLDELPQLLNVLKGEMSFVGPRPNLFNQKDLIKERELRGVYQVRPGITGLSQVCSIDMSMPELLARTDAKMIADFSIKTYFKFIFLTLFGNGFGDRIRGGDSQL